MIADATGANPSGSATWTGLGEAASTRTFNRHSGTTSLTIPDLADPRIDAEIPSPALALGRGTACEWTEAVSAQVRPASIGSMAYWLALAMKKLGGL